LITVGFWCAVGARRSGNKLIGRRGNTVKIMDRLHVLMDARIAEYRSADNA
jgi:hypothetical protein